MICYFGTSEEKKKNIIKIGKYLLRESMVIYFPSTSLHNIDEVKAIVYLLYTKMYNVT